MITDQDKFTYDLHLADHTRQAVIDMGEATLKFKPPYCLHHFLNAPKAKAKKKNKRSKGNTIGT